MKTKSQVFSRFQEFKALVEKQTGRKIRVLRSDNGGEYTSNDFKDFCAREGIKRELKVPYNPQQNGVAERKNRAIVGAARAMLHDQGLPFFLWAEACNTAVYIQNRSPHRVLGSKTPEEAFTGKKKPRWVLQTLKEAKEYVEPPKRAVRESKAPERFCSYMALVSSLIESEPSTFEEAADQQVWRDAMMEEYNSIMKNDVWEIVPRPEGKSVVTSRWLYKIKHAADGSIEKYKARFVARGFSQVEGVDYDETFAPVARYTSIRAVIAIAAEMGWKIHQMDVKTAFLNRFIQEEVYIEQP